MLRHIGMVLALLSALALGASGYAPAQAAEPTEGASMMMDASGDTDAHADMMAQHDCCPNGGMDHVAAADAHGLTATNCDDMADCANGPCCLMAMAVPLLLDGASISIADVTALRHIWIADRPADFAL